MNIGQVVEPESWREFEGVRVENFTKHTLTITVIADAFQKPTIKVREDYVKGEL